MEKDLSRRAQIVTPYMSNPPPAHQRTRVGDKMDLGVRSMNAFLSVCMGQRLGIFSGSGVGKSTLLLHDGASHNFGCQRYWSHRRTG